MQEYVTDNQARTLHDQQRSAEGALNVTALEIPGELRTTPAATSQRSRVDSIRRIWPLFVVGLGLLATVTWMALLSWLLYRLVTLLV